MKKLSVDKLVETVHSIRKEKGLTQAQLAEATGINRAMIGRLENKDYIPTVEQMQIPAPWSAISASSLPPRCGKGCGILHDGTKRFMVYRTLWMLIRQ